MMTFVQEVFRAALTRLRVNGPASRKVNAEVMSCLLALGVLRNEADDFVERLTVGG